MTEIAASDFRHPRRYVRLDTILRLRWLAVLGQLAAIFIVAQGLEFDVPIVPCITIVSLSALLNLALQVTLIPCGGWSRLTPRRCSRSTSSNSPGYCISRAGSKTRFRSC